MPDAGSTRQENESRPSRQNRSSGFRDIIVIGGSAGAIEVIGQILTDLPADLGAAVFVVVHTGHDSPNYLVNIFGKISKLPVQYATDREPIELSKVYVAPNDRHLLIKRGEMRVILGPKENNFRPALDPLFRTAATTYDGRVIGAVVSGLLDDGTHGLMQIKRAGGIAIVQSPDEALQKGMPQSAIDRVAVDYVKPAAEIGPLLSSLVRSDGETSVPLGDDETDVSEGLVSAMRLQGVPAPVPFICPECNGALWEVRNGEVVNYRCHVGHGFAADTLLSRQAMEIEQALWSAVRGFEERAALQKRSAERKDVGSQEVRDRLLQSAREQQQMADVVRALLVGPQVEKPIVGEQFRREYAG
jgi:two-component system chemotaxis response regulator CheB